MMVIEKEYKIIKIRWKAKDTENYINSLARDGWKVVCSYAVNNEYLILERRKDER